MSDRDFYRERVKGTTIDGGSLLSTDYFNLFNEVIMLLGILPEMPDIMEEIDAWRFKTYEEHFQQSGLALAPLAIEAYAHVAPDLRQQFDQTIDIMHMTVQDAREELRRLIRDDKLDVLGVKSLDYAQQLQQLVEMGSAIVHSQEGSLDQGAIDALF